MLNRLLRVAATVLLIPGIADVCYRAGANRATAAMILLLAVPGAAAFGDWLVALLAPIVASLSLSWYFIETVGSLRIHSVEGTITFLTMIVTGLTVSRLSIRGQRRIADQGRRRREMERLNKLGVALAMGNTVAEVAEVAVQEVAGLFGTGGIVLRMKNPDGVFRAGATAGDLSAVIPLSRYGRESSLELIGSEISPEVQDAIAGMLDLFLDRARSLAQRA